MTDKELREIALRCATEVHLRLDHACGCRTCRERDDPKVLEAYVATLFAEFQKLQAGQEPFGFVREIKPGEWKFNKTTSWGADVWKPVYVTPPELAKLYEALDTISRVSNDPAIVTCAKRALGAAAGLHPRGALLGDERLYPPHHEHRLPVRSSPYRRALP